jgi:hypothetical protein
MIENIDIDIDIQAVLRSFERYIEAVHLVGGISAYDVAKGTPIPKGWVHDPNIDYFVPPWFITTPHDTDITH